MERSVLGLYYYISLAFWLAECGVSRQVPVPYTATKYRSRQRHVVHSSLLCIVECRVPRLLGRGPRDAASIEGQPAVLLRPGPGCSHHWRACRQCMQAWSLDKTSGSRAQEEGCLLEGWKGCHWL